MDLKKLVCQPLPLETIRPIGNLEKREQYLINLLQTILPQSDQRSVADELKKSFTFAKHRLKGQRKRKQRKKALTSCKRELLELKGLNRHNCNLKFSKLKPLNELWLSYMKNMLGCDSFQSLPKCPSDPTWDNVGQQLLKADFHGAELSVVRSVCPSLVGLRGLVLQDTRYVFKIIGEDDVLRTIPKKSVVFEIYLEDEVTLELFGKNLCVRTAERSVKKFKTSPLLDL